MYTVQHSLFRIPWALSVDQSLRIIIAHNCFWRQFTFNYKRRNKKKNITKINCKKNISQAKSLFTIVWKITPKMYFALCSINSELRAHNSLCHRNVLLEWNGMKQFSYDWPIEAEKHTFSSVHWTEILFENEWFRVKNVQKVDLLFQLAVNKLIYFAEPMCSLYAKHTWYKCHAERSILPPFKADVRNDFAFLDSKNKRWILRAPLFLSQYLSVFLSRVTRRNFKPTTESPWHTSIR